MFAKAKPMSATEAAGARNDLIESLAQYAMLTDQAITYTNANRAEAIIWQTMTDEELGLLADVMLTRARSSAIVAQSVRGIISAGRYVKSGLIVGPRAWATMQHYANNGGLVLWAIPGAQPGMAGRRRATRGAAAYGD